MGEREGRWEEGREGGWEEGRERGREGPSYLQIRPSNFKDL